ncbi:MAG: cell shape-determining protein [Actinobacteria bacterium]|uniref:Cell shape-determining protein MreC n=2 Tax=freshwater metagenome TaxID=449393 RepID=A0A6J6UEY0_9ZZZZ|nr:cell shape-determining protein [Actinomycetota bacterium]MSY94006.1 cell shape-determining protein [Actinomycetota bacterium]
MRNGGEGRTRLLLIILIVTSLLLITLDLRGVKMLDGVRSGTQNVLAPFQKAGTTVLSPFRNFISDVTHLGRTRNQIEKLKSDNAKLRTRILERKNADAELNQLKSVLDLAGKASYKVIAARVISQGASVSFSQTITIDVGTSSGVRQNMTVISGEGLVGVVQFSYANSALVLLATDPDFKVGVRIAGSQQIGILSGSGSKRASLQLLDNQNIVKVGDILLARGSKNNRPFVPGIPVGYISAVDNSAGSIAQSATVMLYPNYSALGVVSVVLSAGKNNPGDSLVPAAPQPSPIPTVTIYATPSPTASTK